MAILDLRSNQGKYGGSAKAMADLMTTLGNFARQKQDLELQQTLLKGLQEGTPIKEITKTMTEQYQNPEYKGVSGFARRLFRPFGAPGSDVMNSMTGSLLQQQAAQDAAESATGAKQAEAIFEAKLKQQDPKYQEEVKGLQQKNAGNIEPQLLLDAARNAVWSADTARARKYLGMFDEMMAARKETPATGSNIWNDILGGQPGIYGPQMPTDLIPAPATTPAAPTTPVTTPVQAVATPAQPTAPNPFSTPQNRPIADLGGGTFRAAQRLFGPAQQISPAPATTATNTVNTPLPNFTGPLAQTWQGQGTTTNAAPTSAPAMGQRFQNRANGKTYEVVGYDTDGSPLYDEVQ